MLAIHCETWLLMSGHVHIDVLEAHGLFALGQHTILAFLAVQRHRTQNVVMIDVCRDITIVYLFLQKSVKKTREALARIPKKCI